MHIHTLTIGVTVSVVESLHIFCGTRILYTDCYCQVAGMLPFDILAFPRASSPLYVWNPHPY